VSSFAVFVRSSQAENVIEGSGWQPYSSALDDKAPIHSQPNSSFDGSLNMDASSSDTTVQAGPKSKRRSTSQQFDEYIVGLRAEFNTFGEIWRAPFGIHPVAADAIKIYSQDPNKMEEKFKQEHQSRLTQFKSFLRNCEEKYAPLLLSGKKSPLSREQFEELRRVGYWQSVAKRNGVITYDLIDAGVVEAPTPATSAAASSSSGGASAPSNALSVTSNAAASNRSSSSSTSSSSNGKKVMTELIENAICASKGQRDSKCKKIRLNDPRVASALSDAGSCALTLLLAAGFRQVEIDGEPLLVYDGGKEAAAEEILCQLKLDLGESTKKQEDADAAASAASSSTAAGAGGGSSRDGTAAAAAAGGGGDSGQLFTANPYHAYGPDIVVRKQQQRQQQQQPGTGGRVGEEDEKGEKRS